MTLGGQIAKASAECQRRKVVYAGHRKTPRVADLQTALRQLHIGFGLAFAKLQPAFRLARFPASRLCFQASEAVGSSFSSSAASIASDYFLFARIHGSSLTTKGDSFEFDGKALPGPRR